MKRRLECEISGRVQLVMYRDFARRRALARSLTGTAENLKNDNVHIVAEGEEEVLNLFLADLKKGPIFARVTNIEAKWLNPTGEFKDFSIIFYDRH
ncbi:MAG: acylphosphatase [Patescibacteria group bacterium]